MNVGSDFHGVGHHLQVKAQAVSANQRDAYARSAYNRYYYGAFLNVRRFLSEIDTSWSGLPHKSYPEILRGKVTRKFKDQRRRAYKVGDGKLVGRIDGVLRGLYEMADILEVAYGIRVVADYYDNERVEFSANDRFKLRSVSINDAHGWAEKTGILCQSAMNVWSTVDV